MSAASPILEVVVRHKRYGQKTILQDVALKVAAGEIVALVGASGCGKSTLLRIVAGLDDDYRGAVTLHGRELRGITREIGFVFQEPRLFPWLTVAENVAFESGLVGAAAERHPRVAALLADVGLTGLERALPKALSGGQAQRVAIARGLFREPGVLLLDEPFSAVDPFTRIRLQELLATVAARYAATLLLVTHDVDEATALGDRVLVFGASPGEPLGSVGVTSPRPRDRSSQALAADKRRILALLAGAPAPSRAEFSRSLQPATIR